VESLSAMELALVVGVAAVAYLVRGLAGFGSALIATPLLLLVLPITTAVPLVVALDYLASMAHGLRDRQRVCWRVIWPSYPTAVLGVAVAVVLFRWVSAGLLVKAMAVFLSSPLPCTSCAPPAPGAPRPAPGRSRPAPWAG